MKIKGRVLVSYVLLVLVLTGMPGGGQLDSPAGWDKIAHGLMFLVLGLLSSWTAPKKHVMVITGGLLLALATEILQIVVPGRGYEWGDLLADGVGVLLGWSLYQFHARRQRI